MFMNEYFKSFSGVDHPWLKEHLANKLPALEWTVDQLRRFGLIVKVLDNAYLPRWIKMIRLHLYVASGKVVVPFHDYERVNYFYNNIFYEYDNKKPSYRKILVFSPMHFEINSTVKVEDDYSKENEEILDHLIESIYQADEMHRKNLVIQEQSQQILALVAELKLIKNSSVWRAAEFLQRLVNIKSLGKFPLLQKAALTISREGFPQFLAKTKDYLRKKGLVAKMGLIENDYEKWIRKNSQDSKGNCPIPVQTQNQYHNAGL
jgi:hypothetical protein